MATQLSNWTLGEIAQLIGGELRGDPAVRLHKLVSAGSMDPLALTFASSQEYLDLIDVTQIGAVILWPGAPEMGVPTIVVDNPRAAFGRILALIDEPAPIEPGVHELAVVKPGARVAPTASVGPGAVIEATATVGERSKVHANAYVGDNCTVGDDCILAPNAVLVKNVRVGDRCIIHASAVLGASGFGFEWDGERHVKLPQIGGVTVGNDVEIGANTCVDRGMLSDTVIGNGVKIDNLCQIAHNVVIGDDSILTGMVGIGGSSTLGKRVVVGANAGISDHVTIWDDVRLGGRSGVASDIIEPGEYFGQPAQKKRDAIRTFLLVPKLPEIWSRLRALEKRVLGEDGE